MKLTLPLLKVPTAGLFLLVSFHVQANHGITKLNGIASVDTSQPANYYKYLTPASQASKSVSFDYSYSDLYARAEQLKHLAKEKKVNTSYGLFLDLNIASENKRFFFVDLSTNTIVSYGIVTIGNAGSKAANGVYAIGNLLPGKTFALKLLKTKEKTGEGISSLQSSEGIPENNTLFPLLAAQEGLTISPAMFYSINNAVAQTEKSTLLWIY